MGLGDCGPISGGPDDAIDVGGSVMGPIIIGRSLLLLLQLLESTYNDDESDDANGEDGSKAGNGFGRNTVVVLVHTAPLLVTPLGASSGSVKPGTATTTPKKNNPSLRKLCICV